MASDTEEGESGVRPASWTKEASGTLLPVRSSLASKRLDDLEAVLLRLASAADSGIPDAIRVGCESLGCLIPSRGHEDQDRVLESPGVRKAAWSFLEDGDLAETRPFFVIPQLIRALVPFDEVRAVRLAVRLTIPDEVRVRLEGKLLTELAERYPGVVLEELGRWMSDEEWGWIYVADFKAVFELIPENLIIDWVRAAGVEAAPAIARHLQEPRLEDDTPLVPGLAEWVLSESEDDDRVFNEFCAGVDSFKLYRGDIAAEYEAEARVADRFRNRAVPRIREWAERRSRAARVWARQERIRSEEQDLK